MRLKWIVVWTVCACALVACSRQDAGWRDARGEDSTAAYESYLQRFPAGAHAQEARARIRELREEREWARANQLSTPEAFQRYLGAYPEGRFAVAARDRLSDFVLARAPLQEPGQVAGAAGAPVDKSAAERAAVSRYELQLGAYSSATAARQNLSRLARDHADLLGELELHILAPGVETPRLWRLRSTSLGENAARALCAKLAARGEDCVPIAQ